MTDSHSRGSAAFLLAQVGGHAAQRFADRIQVLDLTPSQVGLLRAIAAAPGRSQQQLAAHLGVLPSRVVALVDDLENHRLVRRQRSTTDRRQYELHPTSHGRDVMQQVGRIARAHEQALLKSLDEAERDQLRSLLARIADEQGLTPGVHPGYKRPTSDARRLP